MNSVIREQPPVGLAIWRMSQLLAEWKPKPKATLPTGVATAYLEAERDATLSEACDLFFFPGAALSLSSDTALGSGWTTAPKSPEITEETHFE